MLKCPKCGKDVFDVRDRNGIYVENCMACGYKFEVVKTEARKEFKCKNCSSMRKLTIDEDDRLAFQCFDCGYEETYFYKRKLDEVETFLRDMHRKGKPIHKSEEEVHGFRRTNSMDIRLGPAQSVINDPAPVRCPKCNSTQISTGQRGYSIIWGFVGSGTTANRCANCGYKWRPRR